MKLRHIADLQLLAWLAVLMVLFFNRGFHTANHIRPSIHLSELPENHRREVAPHIDPRFNQRTLLGAIINRLAA